MNTTRTAADHGRIRLKVSLDADEVEKLVIELFEGLGDNTFASHVDFSDKSVQGYLKHSIFRRIEKKILDQESPSPATNPIITDCENVDIKLPLSFCMEFMPMPQFTLKSYEPPVVELPDTSVSEKELDDALSQIVKESVELIEADAGTQATAETLLEMSIEAHYLDGTPYEALSADKRQYRIGEGFMPGSFDNEVLGMRAGETKKFEIPIPVAEAVDDSEDKTTSIELKVTVLRMMEEKAVPITDSWVEANVPGFQSLDDLKSYLRDALAKQKEENRESMKMQQATNVLAHRLDGTIPDDFFEAQYAESCAALDEALKSQGMSRTQFYEVQGIDEQRFRMMTMMDIRDRFSQVFALDAYGRHLGIVVSDDDIKEYLADLASHDSEEARRVEEFSYKSALEEAVVRSKAAGELMKNTLIKKQ